MRRSAKGWNTFALTPGDLLLWEVLEVFVAIQCLISEGVDFEPKSADGRCAVRAFENFVEIWMKEVYLRN